MVPCYDDLVSVRQCVQPVQRVLEFCYRPAVRQVAGVDQDVAIWYPALEGVVQVVRVGDADHADARLVCEAGYWGRTETSEQVVDRAEGVDQRRGEDERARGRRVPRFRHYCSIGCSNSGCCGGYLGVGEGISPSI